MSRWTLPDYEHHKKSVREEIAAIGGDDPKDKLEHIFNKVNELANDTDPSQELRRLVYALNAISQDATMPILSDGELKHFVELVQALLKTNGIKPQTSNLSVIFGDLHLLLSETYMARGVFWRSAWQQHISHHLAGKTMPAGEAYQALTLAFKGMRLGNTKTALELFQEAEDKQEDPSILYKSRMGQLRCLRFLLDFDAADELEQKSAPLMEADEDFQIEAQWERACREVQKTGQLSAMTPLIKKGGSHFFATYVLEGYFWAASAGSTKWMSKLSKISTLVRNKPLGLRGMGIFYKMAATLEENYDSERPLLHRLNKAELAIYQTRYLRNIDKELLVLLAMARWLSRVHSHGLASLVLEEYANLSARVSHGRSRDVLGVSGDLLERDWAIKEHKALGDSA